jgi:hypothetical protein
MVSGTPVLKRALFVFLFSGIALSKVPPNGAMRLKNPEKVRLRAKEIEKDP